jgi:pimeloyl-ACP methyl ester carboxylesterase
MDSSALRPHSVVSRDGTVIAFWSAGSGPPLLLVHGTSADHARWARIWHVLARDFTVYAMDRRGRGASGDAPEYSLEREGEDVAAVVESIGDDVSLLGHSYGALCALEAAMRTTHLHTLILYEPPLPGVDPLVPPEMIDRIDALIAEGQREQALATFFRDAVGLTDEEIDGLRAHPAWPGRIAAAHTIGRESRVELDYRIDIERVRGIRTPTLFLLGSESRAPFHAATRTLRDALPGSALHVFEGQQHMAMDTASEEFVQAVKRFAAAGD